MPPNNSQNPNPESIVVSDHATPVVKVPHKPDASIAHSDVVTPTPLPANAVPTASAPAPTLSIEEQITKKEKEIKEKSDERVKIEEESKKLFSERRVLEEQITPIAKEEAASVAQIEILEKKKLIARDPHEARIAETSRWAEEEHRRGIEHRKWAIGAELEVVDQKIKDVERQFKLLSADEDARTSEISHLRILLAQQALEGELALVSKERTATEEELQRFSKERERLLLLLRESVKREEETVVAEHAVEQKQETVRTVYEEQVLAGERHKLEDARKEAEQKRWEAEDAIPPIAESVAESQKHLDEIKKKEAEILAKLQELEK